jgi:hypothetical protein
MFCWRLRQKISWRRAVLMIKASEAPPEINVVLDRFEELKRRVPNGNKRCQRMTQR